MISSLEFRVPNTSTISYLAFLVDTPSSKQLDDFSTIFPDLSRPCLECNTSNHEDDVCVYLYPHKLHPLYIAKI